MSIENIPSDISYSNTICLIVCVTVTKNISVNTQAFHPEENQKQKGPEVLLSEDISELVFSGKKTREKKCCSPKCKPSHPKTLHTKYLPQLRQRRSLFCFRINFNTNNGAEWKERRGKRWRFHPR